jgi:hypothetical protein
MISPTLQRRRAHLLMVSRLTCATSLAALGAEHCSGVDILPAVWAVHGSVVRKADTAAGFREHGLFNLRCGALHGEKLTTRHAARLEEDHVFYIGKRRASIDGVDEHLKIKLRQRLKVDFVGSLNRRENAIRSGLRLCFRATNIVGIGEARGYCVGHSEPMQDQLSRGLSELHATHNAQTFEHCNNNLT